MARATTPEERIAERLTRWNRNRGISTRQLKGVVDDALPGHGCSHEQIRKYFAGELDWANIDVLVAKVLAAVFGKTLRQLSPELADLDELRHFEYAPRDSNPEPADVGFAVCQQIESNTLTTTSASQAA